MLKLWRERPVLTSAFVLACTLTLFFAARLVVGAVYWANHRDEPVRGWMTVGYVARSWGFYPQEFSTSAGLQDFSGQPMTLIEIARQRKIPVSDVIAQIEATIAALQQEKPQQ